MTEKKRFEYKNHKVFDNLTGEEHSSNMVSVNVLNQLARVNREGVKKVQKLAKENEKLKQQLEDITLNWTENYTNFDKDELYIKDNNTEITLKNNNLLISVTLPQIKEHLKFHYIVTGRRLEREYQYFTR